MAAAEPTTPFSPTPSVIVSHVDIVYRVFGSRARTGDARGIRSLLGRSGRAPRSVHAVKDVSLIAHHGESIGLIGRNGSGKSTLLRAVAGLIPPTKGDVWAHGSPALLGVNAVLVNSLSGSRNVYIGAQALGLSKAEVDAVYDEVVEFSEIGDAIHLPMSTYSSGMAARLRFAISTAAAPGVLIIDEALATGDAHFRERSQERISALREQASTVFIVSHSASTVREMCERAIWLDNGAVVADGPVDHVVDAYEEAGRAGRWKGGATIEPAVPGVERWAGANRFALSSATSRRTIETRPDGVLLVTGEDISMALAAVPVAVRAGTPVILTRPRTVAPTLVPELTRLEPGEVVVLGDEASVASVVLEELAKSGFTLRRTMEVSPVDAIARLVRASNPPLGVPVHLVPHGDGLAALDASLRAAEDGGVVLLMEDGVLSPEARRAIVQIHPRVVQVHADSSAAPEALLETLRPLAVEGADRLLSPTPELASSRTAARHTGGETDVVYVANAVEDVVTASYVAARTGMPLLLVDRDEVPESVDRELRRLRPAHIVVVGDGSRVSTAVRQALREYLFDTPSESETLDELL